MTTTLEHVLAHYCTQENPGYAVLVTGPWGVGKTYQVRHALKGVPHYWVSLFGLRSREEVHAALVSSAWEGGAVVSSIADKAKVLGDSIGGAARLLSAAPAIASAVLERSIGYNRPIIFDDLERCGMDFSATLGVLNDYVEQRGCRVIVIAHDDRIIGELRGRREKLFGRTVRVDPQTEQALDVFLGQTEDGPASRLVAEHRASIQAAFDASKAASLRVLRHVVEDLARLLDLLEDRHLAHSDLVAELVRLFAALDVELRADRLNEEDIAKRTGTRVDWLVAELDRQKGREAKKKPITCANERHALIDVFSTLLTDDLLVSMLVHGRYERGPLLEQLDHDPRLVSPDSEPAWRVLWHHPDYPEHVLNDAARRMREAFDARAITNPGEMLHVFALRVRLARLGLGGFAGTVEEVGDANLAYIDALHAAGTLPPPSPSVTRSNDIGYRDGYDNLGYAVKTEEEQAQFERVYQHLGKMMERARERHLRERHGPELLRLVETDPLRFAEAICVTTGDRSETARHPVLQTIDVQEFVTAWLSGERKGWRHVRDGLEARYESGSGGKLFKAEREWLEAMIEDLHRHEKEARGTWTQPAITNVAMPPPLVERLKATLEDD